MKKLKKALQNLSDRLTYRKGDLEKSRRRAKHFRILNQREHDRQVQAEGNGRPVKAARHQRRAERRQVKAIYWKGRIKKDLAATTDLEARVDKRERELDDSIKEHGVVFTGENKVEGGTPHQRLRAAILRAYRNYKRGDQPGYYSMSGGARDYAHALFHYPHGRIWDCSTFADGVYFCCGLHSPSGPSGFTAGGWTGTEGEHGKIVAESEAKPGDLILYGRAWPHHHVEVVLDPDDKTTIGHGSPPVDPGVFDLFGDGDYVIRRYV
jgi:hypothetical protein